MTAAINSTGAGKRGYPTKSSVPYTQASTQRRARERSVAIQTLLLVRKSKSSDRKSGSAGMPRPISYAVFCLKKKESNRKGGVGKSTIAVMLAHAAAAWSRRRILVID